MRALRSPASRAPGRTFEPGDLLLVADLVSLLRPWFEGDARIQPVEHGGGGGEAGDHSGGLGQDGGAGAALGGNRPCGGEVGGGPPCSGPQVFVQGHPGDGGEVGRCGRILGHGRRRFLVVGRGSKGWFAGPILRLPRRPVNRLPGRGAGMTKAIARIIFSAHADNRMDAESKWLPPGACCGPGPGSTARSGSGRGDKFVSGRGRPERGRGPVLIPGWARLAVVLSACWVQACIPWPQPAPSDLELEEVAAELALVVAPPAGRGEIALLGLRDGKGRRTEVTRFVDEYLRAALEQSGAAVTPADEGPPAPWGEGETVPAAQWESQTASRVVAGRLQAGHYWTYLRLFAIDRDSGKVVASGTRRLPQGLLQAEVASRVRDRDEVSDEGNLQVDLHLLGLRGDGGWNQPAVLEEGGVLQPGDRLQIRFKTATDCEVYAFIFSSQAEVEEVFPPRFVYGGRMHYGPGVENWIALQHADRAYTLYFIAAERLNEDRDELFEAMAALVEQGQVGGRTGMQRLDLVLAEFLRREVEREVDIVVVRGQDGIERGEKADFILADGISVESRPEKLKAAAVLVRAFTFLVP